MSIYVGKKTSYIPKKGTSQISKPEWIGESEIPKPLNYPYILRNLDFNSRKQTGLRHYQCLIIKVIKNEVEIFFHCPFHHFCQIVEEKLLISS